MLACCWTMARLSGLTVMVKGKKKTAWSATYWEADGKERDMDGWEIRMPCGMEIPQLRGEERYRYLGSDMTTGWQGGESMTAVRKEVVRKCKQAIGMVGRVPLITEEQTSRAIALALGGLIGFYGRAVVLTWTDAVAIEEARAQVLRAKHVTTALPRATMYAGRESGLGHEHAYAHAAAALCDQVERAIEGGEGEAARVVVEAELANVCARLGCRGTHPLEWSVSHLMEGPDALREDVIMEAYLRRREQVGVRGKLTKGATKLQGPLALQRWQTTAEQGERMGPALWEQGEKGCTCTFSRRLAAAGVARWADVVNAEGELLTWRAVRARWGIREGGKAKAEYQRLQEEMRAWGNKQGRTVKEESTRREGTEARAEMEREEAEWGDGEWEVEEILAAPKPRRAWEGGNTA
jgi:hypothetical protein